MEHVERHFCGSTIKGGELFYHGREVLPAENQPGCIKANLMLEVSDKNKPTRLL